MKILITAGNTQAPIDRVRCISNIFTGRTGATIALEARRRGHAVTLLTSHPETVAGTAGIECVVFRDFNDLKSLMAQRYGASGTAATVHSSTYTYNRLT